MTTALAGFVDEEERLENGAKGLAALRLLLAILAIAVTLILEAARQGAGAGGPRLFGMHPVYSVAVAACAVDVVYLFLLRYARLARRAAGRLAVLIAVGLGLDILMGAALVYLTGGYESAFLPLLFVWVIAAGTVLSGRAALGAASFAVVCLSTAAVVRYLGVYPYEAVGEAMPSTKLWTASAFHLAQSGALFIVAYLSGVLSKRLTAAQLVADQVLSSLEEGLVVLDRDLRVRMANPKAKALLGVKLPRGADAAEAVGGERLEMVRRLLTSRGKFGPALVALSAAGGGEELTLAVSGSPVRSPHGAFRGLIAVISDRSAERELEDARRLAEQRRAVSELAMSIAHEIRNPLGAVRSAVQEIGREPELSAGGKELVDVVLAESDRLDRIVTDFLTFARPRPPVIAPVALRALVAEAQETITRSAGEDVELEFVNEVPEDVELIADAGQLRQVLLNLGLNAAAAIDGAGRIRVSVREAGLGEFLEGMSSARRARLTAVGLVEAHAARRGLVLSVSDDGGGMPPDVLGRAGEPFFTTRADGTGLGLAIVERVAAAHGGAVNIRSAAGEGTAVEIWFPER